MKKDSFIIGLIIGVLAPFVGVIGFYFWKAPSAKFIDFIDVMLHNSSLLTATISFALLANAAAFTFALNTRRDKMAKGIFLVTLILAIPAIAYKLFS
ncbi:hypothetical protein BH11BAC6_BH11BAC6_12010 [soil metagenome]